MATIAENIQVFGGSYGWVQQGDEWSEPWGGPRMQWFGSILPRIHAFLPAPAILEIAPGFGRWTQFLKDQCDSLTVVDLNEKCIRHCESRFERCSNIRYHVNDGKSLKMVAPHSIDFVFSFDSLVHAEHDVIESYISQIAGLLRPDGWGMIHHSNFGACTPTRLTRALLRTPKLGGWLARATRLGELNNLPWRAPSMTAKKFAHLCARHGLHCVSQELVNWGGTILNDCFSMFARADVARSRETLVIENRHFMDEARRSKALARVCRSDAEFHAPSQARIKRTAPLCRT